MVEIEKKENCCGCSACHDICPMNCIKMQYDKEGFRYPDIDINKCIKCNKCSSVCPIIQKKRMKKNNNNIRLTYAAQNKNEIERLKGSSGGIFSIIARYVINNGGYVVGAVLTDELEVKHIMVDTEEKLQDIYGSKYLQSSLDNVYREVKDKLNNNKKVLFSGTPCQVAALKTFLNKEYENLILLDIVCHGVPSKKAWEKYLKWRSLKTGKKIKKVYFRNKDNGWKKYNVKFEYDNTKSECISHNKDLFFNAYLDNIILRPSCYSCNFKGDNRESDITLGDCWGIQNICPDLDDDKGTSLVLVNSQKGLEIWNNIKGQCNYKEIERNLAFKYNSAAIQSVERHPNQKKFYKNIENVDYEKAVINAMKLNIFQKIFLKIKRKIMKK